MTRKILIVDDSAAVRALENYLLKSVGYEADTASNGVEALEKIYEGDYALVITDVNMPKMDGLRLTNTLREQEAYRDLPIIIVTSESEEEDRMKGIEAGANVYLVKPTKPEQLLLNVKMLLGND
jgi:two-component system chemotaxis response regulator CheY